jgi:hypothetical protein
LKNAEIILDLRKREKGKEKGKERERKEEKERERKGEQVCEREGKAYDTEHYQMLKFLKGR